MAKAPKRVSRRSSRRRDTSVRQQRLVDADGTEIGDARIPEVDDAVRAHLAAKKKRADAKAKHDQQVQEALEARDEAVRQHAESFGAGRFYHAEVDGAYYKIEVTEELLISCKKTKTEPAE